MTTFKVLIGFSRYSGPDLTVKTDSIIDHMTGNANFPTPQPTIIQLTAAGSDFKVALAAADSGSKTDTANKNQKREVLENILRDLGLYVQLNGKNEETILLSSGYDLQKSKTHIGTLAKPENVKVTPGDNKGAVKIALKTVVGADSYIFEYTALPIIDATIWKIKTSTKANVQISDLTSGKEYAFRVAGVGSDSELVYSDVVNSFVL